MKTVGAVAFWKLNIENFKKCTEWLQTELKWSYSKIPYIKFLGPRAPNFIRFSLRPSVCKIFHILWFPSDSHVQFQSLIIFEKIQNFKNLKRQFCADAEEKKFRKSLKRFGRDLWKGYRFLIFPPYGPTLRKTKNKRLGGLDALLDLLPDETNIALWIMAM